MQGTLLQAFLHTVEARGRAPALRERLVTGWHDIAWTEYAAHTCEAAWGLLALDLGPQARLGILSQNCPAWLYSDLGAMRAGIVTVPIYPTLAESQLAHIIAHAGLQAIVVGSRALRERLSRVQGACPNLRHVIVLDAAAAQPGDLTWAQLVERGAALSCHAPRMLAEAEVGLGPDALATIVYTSGTTGMPKGAMLSHGNLVFEANAVLQAAPLAPGDATLSFLPLSHVAERLQGLVVAVTAGLTVHFGRGLDAVQRDLVEVKPEIVVCVPRLWEKMYEAITTALPKAPLQRRLLFEWALRVGEVRWRAELGLQRMSLAQQAQARAADALVGRAVRRRLGLGRAKYLVSGAAPLASTIQTFFGALGMTIVEAYGQTECTGISHGCVVRHALRPGYIGGPLPGTQVRRLDDGEIAVRGGHVFLGYLDDPQATAAALADGWLLTGDVGEIAADGYLRITDRKKDIIVTAGGKNVAPQNIEQALKLQRGISQAVVLGDRRKHLVALLTVDEAALPEIDGRDAKVPHAADPALFTWVQAQVERVNQSLSQFETVKRFAILNGDFTVEAGELTPSLKVRRRVIDERYKDVIERLYDA